MAQQYDLPHPNHLGFEFRKTTGPTEQSQIKCLNQPRHCAHYNSLKVLEPGISVNVLANSSTNELSSHWASSKWLPVMSRPFSNHPEQYRNAPELTQPPGLYSTHGKQEIPPTNGQLGVTTHPILQHTSMQSIP